MSVLTELKNSSRLAAGLVIACVLTFTMVASTLAQEKVETDHPIETESSDTEPEISAFKFASTDSPRDTLSSFVRLTWLLESAMLNTRKNRPVRTITGLHNWDLVFCNCSTSVKFRGRRDDQ